MKSQDMSPNDRESLSALFDGELGDEARRFAMRRLAHDIEWQQASGRWQMIGDAMRRQAPIAAPADFAARVRSAVDAEPSVVGASAAVPPVAARAPRRIYGWAGGALAASVALAAVIGLRPQESSPPESTVATTTAPVPATAPVAPVASMTRPAGRPSDAATASVVAGIAVEPAVADVAPRPTGEGGTRRAPAPRSARTVAAATPRPAASRPASTGSVPTRSAPILVADGENPFRLQSADSIDARPWPRATLTGASTGAFTARYGASGQSSAVAPSFYPFEPRLEGASATTVPSPTP